MFDFQYTEDGIPFVRTEDFSFEPDIPAPGLFTFRRGGLSLSTLEAVPGEFPESMGVPARRKVHRGETGAELGLEAECSIPFGDEPSIRREYLLTDSVLDIRTDFVLRHSFVMNSIVAGGLRAEGVRNVILRARNGETTEIAFSKIAPGKPFFKESEPPLSMILEDEEGIRLEFAPGDALWRWSGAEKLSGRSLYTILKEDHALVFHWNLFEFKAADAEAVPPPGRNWRLTWSLCWNFPDEVKNPAGVFDLAEQEWPDTVKNSASEPCFCSPKTTALLKKWVRSLLASAKEGEVYVVKTGPESLCLSAAHMARAKEKELLHWDRESKFDFQCWANRQLAASGAKLVIEQRKSAKPDSAKNRG